MQGQEVEWEEKRSATIINNTEFLLVAVLDSKKEEAFLGDHIPIFTSLNDLIYETEPDVLVDLTVPSAVYEHAMIALDNGVRPVIGTTGFTDLQLEDIRNKVEEKECRMYYCTKLFGWRCTDDEVCSNGSKVFTRSRNNRNAS